MADTLKVPTTLEEALSQIARLKEENATLHAEVKSLKASKAASSTAPLPSYVPPPQFYPPPPASSYPPPPAYPPNPYAAAYPGYPGYHGKTKSRARR